MVKAKKISLKIEVIKIGKVSRDTLGSRDTIRFEIQRPGFEPRR